MKIGKIHRYVYGGIKPINVTVEVKNMDKKYGTFLRTLTRIKYR